MKHGKKNTTTRRGWKKIGTWSFDIFGPKAIKQGSPCQIGPPPTLKQFKHKWLKHNTNSLSTGTRIRKRENLQNYNSLGKNYRSIFWYVSKLQNQNIRLFLTLTIFKVPFSPAVTYYYTQCSPSVSFDRYHSPPTALLISSLLFWLGQRLCSPVQRSIFSIDNNKGKKNAHITTSLKYRSHLLT